MKNQNFSLENNIDLNLKKPLREILSKYLEKTKKNDRSIDLIKEELNKVKTNIGEVKNGFQSLIEMHEKLKTIYEDIKDEKKEKSYKNY